MSNRGVCAGKGGSPDCVQFQRSGVISHVPHTNRLSFTVISRHSIRGFVGARPCRLAPGFLAYRAYRKRKHGLRHVARLYDYLLRDIGLEREDVDKAPSFVTGYEGLEIEIRRRRSHLSLFDAVLLAHEESVILVGDTFMARVAVTDEVCFFTGRVAEE